jgi:hypothetical protein
MRNLKKLSIKNCTGLTTGIDLTMCTAIQEVYATGTNINVLIPNNSIVTNYELGFPTTVRIITPQELTPAGIVVDGYRNITSIEITKGRGQSSDAYAMFDKIMTSY